MHRLNAKPKDQSRTASSSTGVVFAIGTAFCFGVSTPLAKLLLQDVQPWMLAGLMFLGGGLGLLPVYLIRRWRRQQIPTDSLQWEDRRSLFLSILAGGIVAPVLLMTGLEHSSAAITSLLLNFESVFTALVAWSIFREPWHWKVLLGIIIITAGGILVSQANVAATMDWSWGALAILGTCLGWAIDSNFTTQIAHRDAVQVAIYKSGGAGLINVAIATLMGQPFPSFAVLLKVAGAGLIGYGFTYWCFVLALRQLGASRTGAFFALSPLVGVAIAILFLGEPFTAVIGIAAILMASGAMLCAAETA